MCCDILRFVTRLNWNGCVIVKIGVALSGCHIGGVSAWSVLRELEAQGFDLQMVSACCVPATTSLLYASGCEDAAMKRLSLGFLSDARESDIDFAVANLSAAFREGNKKTTPLAINAVNVTDGNIVMFTDDVSLRSSNLKTFADADPYDILSATISLMDGLGSYRYGGQHLCDFCCWYGCPVHALKLAGVEKIISIAFVPKFPKTPYEVLVKQMIASSASAADIHISIEFASRGLSFEQYEKIATTKIKSSANKILLKTLF